MPITPLKFPEVLVIETSASIESRLPVFVKDNHSYGIGNVVRGMHIQPGQAKLVHCECGSVWNAIVDARPGSTTFGQWDWVELDEGDNKRLYIPVGFAHGFYTKAGENYLIIRQSAEHSPERQVTFAWNDAAIAVEWPFIDKSVPPILSVGDTDKPPLSQIPPALLIG